MKHQYRLGFEDDPVLWPLSDEEIIVLDAFQKKYNALATSNESLKRSTFHFGSDNELVLKNVKNDLLGFKIVDFYEANLN